MWNNGFEDKHFSLQNLGMDLGSFLCSGSSLVVGFVDWVSAL